MKRIILFILIISLIFTDNQLSNAQKQGQPKLDSLVQELGNFTNEDTLRVNLLSVIAYEFYHSDPIKGMEYAEEGIKIAKKLDFKTGLAYCYRALGINYTVESNYAKGFENFLLAYNLFEETGDKKGIGLVLGGMGSVYNSQKNYSKALEYYLKALKIHEEIGNKKDIAINYGNIANVYNLQADYPLALDYYQKALVITEQSDDKASMATLLGNIGSLYLFRKDYRKALEYHLKSLEINNELKNSNGIMFNYGSIGMDYVMLANDTLKSSQNKSKPISKFEKNRYLKLAIDYMLRAIEIGREINANRELISWYANLADVYSELKMWEKAFNYAKLSLEVNESVFSQQSKSQIETLENQQERELKDKEIKIKNLELDRHQLINLFTIGGLILLSLLTFLIYTRFRIKKKSNEVLERKNKLISDQNQEISEKNEQLIELNLSKDKYLNMLKGELEHAANYIRSLIPQPITPRHHTLDSEEKVGTHNLLIRENVEKVTADNPEQSGIRTNWFYVPSLDVGGDSFGYHWIDETHFSFYLFDVSGHGIKAALHSVSILNNIKNQTLPNANFYSSKDVLMNLNKIYQMSKHNNLFFTIWYGVFNIKTKELTYSSAGHPYPLLIPLNSPLLIGERKSATSFSPNKKDGFKVKSLGLSNPMIGGFPDFDFDEKTIVIENKSVIYIYSDGVYEIMKTDKTFWNKEELDKYLLENHQSAYGSELERLYQYVQSLHGSEHLDDDFSILKIEFDFD